MDAAVRRRAPTRGGGMRQRHLGRRIGVVVACVGLLAATAGASPASASPAGSEPSPKIRALARLLLNGPSTTRPAPLPSGDEAAVSSAAGLVGRYDGVDPAHDADGNDEHDITKYRIGYRSDALTLSFTTVRPVDPRTRFEFWIEGAFFFWAVNRGGRTWYVVGGVTTQHVSTPTLVGFVLAPEQPDPANPNVTCEVPFRYEPGGSGYVFRVPSGCVGGGSTSIRAQAGIQPPTDTPPWDVAPDGGYTPPIAPQAALPHWRGWDVARGTAIAPSGTAGYVLDAWGGLHPWSDLGVPAPPSATSGGGSWQGWDIARGVALVPGGTGGYVLDGFGGLHPFGLGGHAPPAVARGGPYWRGWDIARGVTLQPDGSGGYVVDAWGGVHPFAIGARARPPRVVTGPYWPGWPIVHGIATTGPSGGYVLDGFGGLHPFAAAGARVPHPAIGAPYWSGADIARGVAVDVRRFRGVVVDGYGALHSFADATVPSAPTGVKVVYGPEGADLSWRAPPDGGTDITGYVVKATISGLGTVPIAQPTGSQTRFRMTDLISGRHYTFEVGAVNALGRGPLSAPLPATLATRGPLAATAVAQGWGHACLIDLHGGARCWGDNGAGQLGTGTNDVATVATPVVGLQAGVTSIAAGYSHSCAVASGGAWCWGENGSGELGDGTRTDRLVPVPVQGLAAGVASISTGGAHTCAVLVTGSVRCWGANWAGQLGDGTTVDRRTPTAVVGITGGATAVSAGLGGTCALVDGGATCWGEGDDGSLGNGGSVDSTVPVAVTGLASGVVQVQTSGVAACALAATGDVQCWGYGPDGQLGGGPGRVRRTPQQVVDLHDATTISVGHTGACAVRAGGGVACWGGNNVGQLGDGTYRGSRVPVAVLGLPGPVVAVAGLAQQGCGLGSDGLVRCWSGREVRTVAH